MKAELNLVSVLLLIPSSYVQGSHCIINLSVLWWSVKNKYSLETGELYGMELPLTKLVLYRNKQKCGISKMLHYHVQNLQLYASLII